MSFKGIRTRDLVRFRTQSGRLRYGRAERGMIHEDRVGVRMIVTHVPAGSRRPLVLVTESNYVSHKAVVGYWA